MSVESSEQGGKARRGWGAKLPHRLWVVVGLAAIGAAACGSTSSSTTSVSTNVANINPTAWNTSTVSWLDQERQRHGDTAVHADRDADPGRLHRRLRDARPPG